MIDPELFRVLAIAGAVVFLLLPLIMALVALRHLRNIDRQTKYLQLSEQCRNANGRHRE